MGARVVPCLHGSLVRTGLLALLFPLLAACGSLSVSEQGDSGPSGPVDLDHVADPEPRALPLSQYGNPDSYEVFGTTYYLKDTNVGYDEEGTASWYGTKFHGRRTSSGEDYDMYAMTAAHKTLPIPVHAEVTNLDNGRSVIVRINDRGPFHEDRIIDLSYAAAYRLGFHDSGTAPVRVRTIVPGTKPEPAPKTTTARARPAEPSAPVVPEDEEVPAPGNHWFLQVGAFGNEANARRLRNQLAGNEAIEPVEIQRKDGVHRVRIGPLGSAGAADRMARRLAELNIEPVIVQE
ncbi:MAG: septal ring lytic transglycosylase RlpA family protein [Pseudomonadota bacterium]